MVSGPIVDTAHPQLHWVPYHQDPLAELAQLVLTQHRPQLPDLSTVSILIPDPAAASSLRRQLVQQAAALNHAALLGPRILTLRQWANDYAPQVPRCHEQARRLLLVEALRDHPDFLSTASPWALADGLVQLFDELTLNQVELPDSPAGFNRVLSDAYGVHAKPPTGLGNEANLVYTVWQAWHTQLAAAGQQDPQQAYRQALQHSCTELSKNDPVYLAGFTQLSGVERVWLQALFETGRLHLMLQGNGSDATGYHPDAPGNALQRQLGAPVATRPADSPREHVLDAVYSQQQPGLAQRAREMAQRYPDSPLTESLAVFEAGHHEEEAHAVELQVRRWLLAGSRNIAIVTENRKLARRVRALLERAGVSLEDVAGWALSTTSAAAALERWLACIEEDFAYLPLLDLLKSPFLGDVEDREQRREAVYRFERDIVHWENIGSNLNRYRRGIEHRLARLSEFHNWSPATAATLNAWFDQLETAAQPVHALRRQRAAGAGEYIDALRHSLSVLAMDAALAADPAGQRLLQALEQLSAAAAQWTVKMNWSDFRAWLGQTLEQHHFRPNEPGSPVKLLGLGQSALQTFDALIIAGADQEHLPAAEAVAPFFNDAVRRELGLSTRTDVLAEQLHHFRRLLSAADRVLITTCNQLNGEPVPPSPWLAALQAFHRLAWHTPLESDLKALLSDPRTLLHRCPDATLPEPQSMPAPRLEHIGVPDRLSATGYQQLMNCPYQFYVARCLQLTAPEEIQLALSKGDYGERIHTCLQAFHSNVEHLPGPFDRPFNPHNRAAAIDLLMHIANEVFKFDLNDHFEHLGWLRQWQQLIPAYVDWQIQHSANWQPLDAEVKQERALTPDVTLNGRIDRIDSSAQGLAILDYKTGAIPTKDDVDNGEAVQLPFYTLLTQESDHVEQVSFVRIDTREGVHDHRSLSGDELAIARQSHHDRLLTLHHQLREGSALPAWGDSDTCQRCDMKRVCRYGSWLEADTETTA